MTSLSITPHVRPHGPRGVTALIPVPGFADQPVAMAELADGAPSSRRR